MHIPVDTSPVIAAYVRTLSGSMGDDARDKLLLPLVFRMKGTADLDPQKLAYMAADRAVRVFSSTDLEAVGLTEQAEKVRELPEIVDVATAKAAQDAATEVAYESARVVVDVAAWAVTWAVEADAEAVTTRAADAATRFALGASDHRWRPAIELLEDMLAA